MYHSTKPAVLLASGDHHLDVHLLVEIGYVALAECHLDAALVLARAVLIPARFTEEKPLPVGIEFMTQKSDEAKPFKLAYSYEQTSRHRQAPAGFGPFEDSIDDWGSELIEGENEDQRRNYTVEKIGQCE